MCGGIVGDILDNEVSHMGNLFQQIGDNPGKSLEQFALGAADPLGAKLWGGITGQDFTPMVNQFGGETGAQFAQSDSEGVNTRTSRLLGHVADTVAGIWGGSAAGSAIGGALGGGSGGAAAEGGGALAEGSPAGYWESGGGYVGPTEYLHAGEVGGAGAGGAAGTDFGGSGTDPAVSSPKFGLADKAQVGAHNLMGGSYSGLGKTALEVFGPSVVSSALAPRPPGAPAPTLMPDPLAQEEEQRRKVTEQLARRGRSSTIMTSPGGGSLGG